MTNAYARPYADGRVTTDRIAFHRDRLHLALPEGQGATLRLDMADALPGVIQFGSVHTKNAVITDLTDDTVALIIDPETPTRTVRVSLLNADGDQHLITLEVSRVPEGENGVIGGSFRTIDGFETGPTGAVLNYAQALKDKRTQLTVQRPLTIGGQELLVGDTDAALAASPTTTNALDYEVMRD